MFVSQFLQNTEEIGEDDDGVEVTSQTFMTNEVSVEEQMGSGSIADMHNPKEDEYKAIEGDIQDNTTRSCNLPYIPTGKGVEDMSMEFEGNLSEK